ncbi:MAG: HEAT repeat domain-containing protein [Magnetococcus sp. YQC-5]
MTIMILAFENKLPNDMEGLPDALLDLLERKDDLPINHAAAWALNGLSSLGQGVVKPFWTANGDDAHRLDRALDAIPESEKRTRLWLIKVLCNSNDSKVLPFLLARLNNSEIESQLNIIEALGKLGGEQAVAALLPLLEDDSERQIRLAVIEALGKLGGEQAVAALLPLLKQNDQGIRFEVASVLMKLGDGSMLSIIKEFLDDDNLERRVHAVKLIAQTYDKIEQRLLSIDIDGLDPWIDPREPITEVRIATVAKQIDKTTQDVRLIYESLAADFHLEFA